MKNVKQRKDIEAKYKWDIESIYSTKQEVVNDMKKSKKLANELKKMEGHILSSAVKLEQALNLVNDLSRLNSKLVTYVKMKNDEDTKVNENKIILGKVENLINSIGEQLSFYTPELLSKDYELILKYIKENNNLKKYQFYLEDIYRIKKHVLSADKEELISKMEEIFEAPSNIFGNINNTDIKFSKFKDEEGNIITLNQSNYAKYIESYDRDIRKSVFKKLYKGYSSLKNTFAKCLSSDIKVDTVTANIRGYKTVLDMSLYQDNIDPKLYDKLIKNVSDRLNIVHKYIEIRKKILNFDKIHMYDLYVPLVKKVNKSYSYEDAQKMVIEALEPLGKDYKLLLEKAFKERWIDVYFNEGKKVGAYSGGSYDTKPFLLINFEGTLNNVSILAHELGHSIHSYYSNNNQEYHDATYPIFLAEIASTVNEMFLNKYLYNNAKTKEEKLYYLNDLLDSFRSTLIRQTMFAEFEKITHDKVENNEILTSDEFCKIYLKLNKKYYGENIVHNKEIKYEWMRIPHFYSSFYVYKYATGIAIAAKIVKNILNKKEKALDNYLTFLKSGGSDYPLNILKKVGIDILNDDTINEALDLYEETLNEFIKVLESK